MERIISTLREHGIQPTPQRIAVAEYVLDTRSHPSADEVWNKVRLRCPTVSRATIYNTLNLFVEKGLLKAQLLKEDIIVFDPHVEAHHHFVDEETGEIFDVPWEAIQVTGERALGGFKVREYQVVMRGRRTNE